jgi:hypothetical protein
MDKSPTIDLATTEQLIRELMSRQSFIGVIVAKPTDFVCRRAARSSWHARRLEPPKTGRSGRAWASAHFRRRGGIFD